LLEAGADKEVVGSNGKPLECADQPLQETLKGTSQAKVDIQQVYWQFFIFWFIAEFQRINVKSLNEFLIPKSKI
jgi:hypothetical protein